MAWQDVPSLTKKQVSALQDEAIAAGDYKMAEICAAAMEGDPVAMEAVAKCLRDAAAQRGE